MKKYTAVVIDGKKLIRRITVAITAVVVAAACILNINIADIDLSTSGFSFARNAVSETVPALGAADAQNLFDRAVAAVKKGISFVLTFDPFDPRNPCVWAYPPCSRG